MKKKNERPILVTDSGVGGLVALHKLATAFPNEKFIYYSDVKNMPYGEKSKKIVLEFCKKRIEFAANHNAKLIVVACNTMSVVGKDMFSKSKIPIIKIVAADAIDKENIQPPTVMFCTSATANSLAIGRLSHINVVPLPTLASDIEEHVFDECYTPECLKKSYGEIKTLILGCTHYSLIENVFESIFRPVRIIDGTEKLPERVSKIIGAKPDVENKETAEIVFCGSGARRMAKVYKTRFLNR